MTFSLYMQLGRNAEKAIKAGIAEYDARKGEINPTHLVPVVIRAVSNWHPEVNGREILTTGLRASFAKALAGLAYNMAAAKAGRDPA